MIHDHSSFRCASCSVSDTGLTSRHLRTRVGERYEISPRTNKPVLPPNFSNIREHCLESSHDFSEEGFKILSIRRNKCELNLLDTLLIKDHVPS